MKEAVDISDIGDCKVTVVAGVRPHYEFVVRLELNGYAFRLSLAAARDLAMSLTEATSISKPPERAT